jgi:hypothetical protein
MRHASGLRSAALALIGGDGGDATISPICTRGKMTGYKSVPRRITRATVK